MIKALIISNDPKKECLIKELERHTKNIFYQRGWESLQWIQEIMIIKPDIIFIDINLYNYCFLSIGKYFKQGNHHHRFIFLVQNKNEELTLLKNGGLHYIVMPIKGNQMKIIIDDFMLSKRVATQYDEQSNICSKMAAYKEAKTFVLDFSDVYFFFADSGQSKITAKGCEEYYNKYPLKYWESRLSLNKFRRCHRSYIINLDYIEQITPWYNNTMLAMLCEGGYQIPISRTYVKVFKRLLGM